MSESDRISYAFGMKINCGNYESADFHISFSSDVQSEETPHEAFKRIQKFVETAAEEKLEELTAMKKETISK